VEQNHDVLRLEIPMHDFVKCMPVQAAYRIPAWADSLAGRDPVPARDGFAQERGQRLPLQVFHHDVGRLFSSGGTAKILRCKGGSTIARISSSR